LRLTHPLDPGFRPANGALEAGVPVAQVALTLAIKPDPLELLCHGFYSFV
jgi:hypothetical protein